MEHRYTAGQLMEAANLSIGLYQQWKARGFIESSYEVSGTGNKQLYSFKEVLRVAVVAELVAMGVSISSAAKVTPLHGFKNEVALLLLRRFPILGVDFGSGGATYEEEISANTQVQSCIIRASTLAEEISRLPAASIVNLNLVEERVKKSLGIE